MIEAYERAGKIVSKIRKEASKIIKDDLAIIDLVEFVETKIKENNAGMAFPVNVSINEIAAHYTSPFNDENKIKSGDLVKLDLGAQIGGYIADSAITIMAPGNDLEDKYDEDILSKNQELIEASNVALETAISTVKPGIEVGKIGKAVEEEVNKLGFRPIANLTGHSLEQWDLHSGLSIPSVNDRSTVKLKEGDVIAIEPFVTDGVGWVTDTPQTYIYCFLKNKPFRMKQTQNVLKKIEKNYSELPFSQKWLAEDFNPNRLNASLRQLSEAMAIYPYPALKEKTNCWVAQKEHTVIVEGDSCIITTK